MENNRVQLGYWIVLILLFTLGSHSAIARRQDNLRISGNVPSTVNTQMNLEGRSGLYINHNSKKMALTVSLVNSAKSVVIEAFSAQNLLPLIASDTNSKDPLLVELASP